MCYGVVVLADTPQSAHAPATLAHRETQPTVPPTVAREVGVSYCVLRMGTLLPSSSSLPVPRLPPNQGKGTIREPPSSLFTHSKLEHKI